MDPCMKTLRKIPMAMVGAVDLVICTAMKAGNCLAQAVLWPPSIGSGAFARGIPGTDG